MKTEVVNGISLPKIGFGTWRIGGGSTADPALDKKSLDALRSALELGYTHFDTAEMYAGGHAEELLRRAIHDAGVKRENLFITSKVLPQHLRHDDVLKSCEGSLHRLGTDYLDLYLIHWPALGMNLADTFKALNRLVRGGQVKHVGVSNFNLKLLRQSQELCGTGLLSDQVPYGVFDRTYARNGVLKYCQDHSIFLTAYSPLGQGHFRASRTLNTVAENHRTTPQQIALAWLVSQPSVITIPMSFDPVHQAENLTAADIVLTDDEMERFS